MNFLRFCIFIQGAILARALTRVEIYAFFNFFINHFILHFTYSLQVICYCSHQFTIYEKYNLQVMKSKNNMCLFLFYDHFTLVCNTSTSICFCAYCFDPPNTKKTGGVDLTNLHGFSQNFVFQRVRIKPCFFLIFFWLLILS